MGGTGLGLMAPVPNCRPSQPRGGGLVQDHGEEYVYVVLEQGKSTEYTFLRDIGKIKNLSQMESGELFHNLSCLRGGISGNIC